MNRLPIKFVSLLLLITINASASLTIGETFALLNDVENSNDSSFEIGILDFSLSSNNDFLPNLSPTETTSSRSIDISEDGTLGIHYKVKVENSIGTLCSYLELKDDLTGSYQSLINYISNETSFSVMPSLVFTTNSSSYDSSLQGEICNFDLVFEAWQNNLSDNTQGFTDKEIINSTIRMSYWDSDVVMNEFLPNADNYFEYIEFYNNGASTVDMDGFYVMAGVNRIDVNSVNTTTYSGGLTTIAPNSWLVITTGGDKLNDSAGTLTLYNSNDVEMDSYTYNSAEYNINNNPGRTNDLVAYLPFEGDLLDGSGNNNNGTSQGITGFSNGKINQALSLDGSGDYIEIPDSSSLDITDQITLEAWVYPETWDNDVWPVIDGSTENSILTKAGDADYGVWNLHYKTENNLGFRFEMKTDDDADHALYEKAPPENSGEWYHIVGIYDGSKMYLYINGILNNFIDVTGNIKTNDAPLRIGKQLWYENINSYWDGSIDEVKIYDRALSANEVLEHYNDIGPSDSVPVDKSYARIPDGIGGWVDPIPTPGTPNKLDIKSVIAMGTVQETIDEPIIIDSPVIIISGSAVIDEIVEETTPTEPIIITTILEIEPIREIEEIEQIEEIVELVLEELIIEQVDIPVEEIVEEQIEEIQEETTEQEIIEEEIAEPQEEIIEEIEETILIEQEVELIEEELIAELIEIPVLLQEPQDNPEEVISELTDQDDEITI